MDNHLKMFLMEVLVEQPLFKFNICEFLKMIALINL